MKQLRQNIYIQGRDLNCCIQLLKIYFLLLDKVLNELKIDIPNDGFIIGDQFVIIQKTYSEYDERPSLDHS